ncbi:hypothetical protein KVT40_005838 [Elsinoe batatas]|uniref:Impact N-terminal domain-containing protein n=1 Tax=Elsinoe batatas TaxID=2601811 RepID=A0A8K0PGZ0_9PEZI|nr:hypothetical protein KVT40_005838 [Elsinoe batatas]
MSATDVQALLRFLTKDAKVPLAMAMSKVKELQDAQLGSVEALSKAKLDPVKTIFPDEKLAKSVHNAAKRINKKRAAGEDTTTSPVKKIKKDPFEVTGSKPASEVERELELAVSNLPAEDLEDMVFITNRAPLVLAFAATVVKFTMPEQPPSSQLSLAQAVVSLGSQSKAKAIGLQKIPTAEDEGWSQGQPTVKVMNREISVLKRWGYEWRQSPPTGEDSVTPSHEDTKVKPDDQRSELPALWAIDLEQLKHLNGPLTFPSGSTADTAGLPVYSPQAAKGYILRSFDAIAKSGGDPEQKPGKKKPAAVAAAERAANVACVLKALNLLFESWASTLSSEELDKRSWSWYVHVRPDVEHGVPGWGQKGPVKLKDILDLRRTP